MNVLILSYITQFAPVIFGIIFVLAVKSLRLKEERLIIGDSQDLRVINALSVRIPENEPHSVSFERLAYDALVEGGHMKSSVSRKTTERLAMDYLGFVDVRRMKHVRNDGWYRQKLTLFATENEEMLRILLDFSKPSGMLLAYLSEHELQIKGV